MMTIRKTGEGKGVSKRDEERRNSRKLGNKEAEANGEGRSLQITRRWRRKDSCRCLRRRVQESGQVFQLLSSIFFYDEFYLLYVTGKKLYFRSEDGKVQIRIRETEEKRNFDFIPRKKM